MSFDSVAMSCLVTSPAILFFIRELFSFGLFYPNTKYRFAGRAMAFVCKVREVEWF